MIQYSLTQKTIRFETKKYLATKWNEHPMIIGIAFNTFALGQDRENATASTLTFDRTLKLGHSQTFKMESFTAIVNSFLSLNKGFVKYPRKLKKKLKIITKKVP